MNNLSVVAIGGGSIASSVELVKSGIDMAGVETQPSILVIPTPSTTLRRHDKRVVSASDFFSRQLGLPTDFLHNFDCMPDSSELEEKIAAADVAYITGGSTSHMMERWKRHGIDSMLTRRAMGGLVLIGISAGAIAPFSWGQSDPFTDRKAQAGEYVATEGLGIVGAAIAPHYNRKHVDGTARGGYFQDLLSQRSDKTRFGFGVDEGAALVVHDGALYAEALGHNTITVLERIGEHSEQYRLAEKDSISLDRL